MPGEPAAYKKPTLDEHKQCPHSQYTHLPGLCAHSFGRSVHELTILENTFSLSAGATALSCPLASLVSLMLLQYLFGQQ